MNLMSQARKELVYFEDLKKSITTLSIRSKTVITKPEIER